MTDTQAINRTRILFCDLLNIARGKYVSAKYAAGGKAGFARGVFGTTLDRDLISVPGIGLYTGIPDMELAFDEQRRIGWVPGTDIALGDLMVEGEPFGLCARGQLRRTVKQWQDSHGLVPKVGIELEAYVFEKDAEGVYRPYDTPGAFVYGIGPQNDPRGLVDAIWERAHAAGIPIESMNGEFDNGQFELTLAFSDAVEACDNAFLARALAKEVALEKGLLLTFLAKPIPERGGSGVHVNFSFADQDGNNVIAPQGQLSDVAKGAIAGMMAHHEGLAGLLATTVNSYDRLMMGSMAGYWCNWAEDHRMTTVRTSTGSAKSARLEHRMADGGTNPYLATHAVLQAALLGVDGQMPLPKPEDLDGLENVRATRHVPANLSKSLDALEADKTLKEALGELLCDALIFLKRDEVKRLDGKTVDEVRDFYLPFI